MKLFKNLSLAIASSMLFSVLLSGCGQNEPKSLKDATEKEYNDFMKWDAKQQQKKRDESPTFGN